MFRRALMSAFASACALSLFAGSAWARDYYVAPTGSDSAAGTEQAPWRTVARVNSAALAPGDVVRFAGGGVWHAMLAPAASGTAAAPITFGTYGSGRAVLDGAGASGFAGIAVNGRSWLAFEHLDVRAWSDGQGAYLAGARSVRFSDVVVEDSAEGFHQSPSAPSTAISIERSRVSRIGAPDGSGVGINVTTGSAGWHVSDTVLEHVADSCVIDQGADSLYERVTATDCGFGGLTYGTHGFYLKGPRQTVKDSTVRHAYTNCISVRFQDAVVEGNTVADCPIGIAWFEYATAPGTVSLLRNRISDAGTGIYIDYSPSQSFRISQNTVVGGRRDGTRTDALVSNDASALAITNNVAVGRLRKVLDVAGTAAGAYTQRGNALYAPGAQYAWNGRFVSTATAYASLRGQRSADLLVDPRLVSTSASGPDFHLSAGSPARDTGVRDPAGLALTTGCDGAAEHYCGAAPEPGALELTTTVGRVQPNPATPAATAPGAPAGIAATLHGTAATLTWRAPAGGAASYLVTAAGTADQDVTATRVTVPNLHLGRTYTFAVRTTAVDGSHSAAVTVVVKVPAALRPGAVRPRLVSASRHSLVVRIPRAVQRGTLRVAGRVLRVHAGVVRIRHLRAGRRYVLRVAVRQADGSRVTAAVAARTR